MFGPILTALHDHVVHGALVAMAAMIALNLVTGIASAIRVGDFNSNELPKFIETNLFPGLVVVGTLVAALFTAPGAYNADVSAFLLAAAGLSYKLVTSVVENVAEIATGTPYTFFDDLVKSLLNNFVKGETGVNPPNGVQAPIALPAPTVDAAPVPPIAPAAPVAAEPANAQPPAPVA